MKMKKMKENNKIHNIRKTRILENIYKREYYDKNDNIENNKIL